MEINTNESDGISVVTIEGRLDTNTSAEAQTHINGVLDAGTSKLAIDLTAIDYVSSAGLRILLAPLSAWVEPAGSCASSD